MKKQAFNYISFFLVIVFMIILLFNQRSIQTITFFPIDEDTAFDQATTSLSLEAHEQDKPLKWKTHSKSDRISYLRQDVSLLFGNGKLKGVKSQWVDHADIINMEERLTSNKNILWEAISFHYGELQNAGTDITSVQDMSYDYLYIIPSSNRGLIAFQKPLVPYKQRAQKDIDLMVKGNLLNHWHKLATHFNVSLENYQLIPFTNLFKYSHTPLPNMTTSETNRIIGQLWEGVYKNYIVTATKTKNMQLTGLEPIVLLDKNQTHILVLFELNNKKDMLIQRI